MAYLHILTEDENDDFFFSLCLEKMTGKQFQVISKRLRVGAGISNVRQNLRLMLNDIVRTGEVEDNFFLVVVDNDRSPEHPQHNRLDGLADHERSKSCRFCELQMSMYEILGEDRTIWPIKGAIAVPVQMLESWLLLILDVQENEDDLPLFSWKKQTITQRFYAPQIPPDQLKDLCELEKDRLDETDNASFYFRCIEQLNVEDLANKSRSFALFKEQVDQWVIDS